MITWAKAGMMVPPRATYPVVYLNVECGTLAERPIAGFPHRVRDEGRVGGECVALFRVQQQGDRPVADQAGGGVVPGDYQLEDRGEHLLLSEERAVLIGRAHQVGDQILARAVRSGEQPGQ